MLHLFCYFRVRPPHTIVPLLFVLGELKLFLQSIVLLCSFDPPMVVLPSQILRGK